MSARCAGLLATSMRDHVAICFEKFSCPRSTWAALIALAFGMCLASCSGQSQRDPVEIFSTSVAVDGAKPSTVTQQLQRGVYLVEAREQDIDARITVYAKGTSSLLEDRLARHGAVYKVVSIERLEAIRINIASVDHRTKRGKVIVRISRFVRDIAAPPGEIESGYMAQSIAGELSARGDTDKWALAADKLHEAVSHFETAGDESARGQAVYTLAYIQYGPRDQFAAAVRACETATEAFRRAGDDVGVQNAATLRAAAEIELASSMSADTQRAEQRALFAEADRRLTEAANFFELRGLPVRAEYAINMRAVRAAAVGEYDSATALLTRAVEMARANADVREQTLTLANLAAIHVYLGQVAQAALEYESLLPLIDKKTQAYQYAGLLTNYGAVSITLGDFDRALELHTEALEIYSKLGEEDERAVELSALGSLYFRMGDSPRALETLRSAIDAQEKISDAGALTVSLRLAGNVASALGQHGAALEYLKHSARIDGNPHGVARTNVLIAGELRLLGQLATADSTLSGPLASTNQLVHASALEERAHIRLVQGRAASAIADLRSADAEYAALGLEIDRIDVNTSLSRALLAANDIPNAIVAADRAIAIVGRVRGKSANPEWRARFLSARYAPYEARIAAELAGSDPSAPWRSFRIAEELRARSLADELHVGGKNGALRTELPEETALRAKLTSLQLRLESNLQKGTVDESSTQNLRRAIAETRAQIDSLRARHGVAAGESSLPDSLSRVQSELPKDTAVLAYYVGDISGYAWILSRGGLKYAVLPDRQLLEAAIVDAQNEERHGAVSGSASRKLGRMLFGNLLDGLQERRLLLLADGPLHGVPFAAVPLPGSNEQLLIDRFVVASAPSLALAMSSPKHARSRNSRVAVVSDPVYASDDRRLALAMRGDGSTLRGPPPQSPNNLTRLPYSALEAAAVATAFGTNDAIQLAGFDAIPQRVMELPSQNLAVLHFATHAVAHSDSPDQSALFLTEYARDGSLLPASRITVDDIARSGLRADVVVLSGCATGDGRALRGEGVLGLTYSFLANGSHSVVASLWPIEDASTARFMSEFYRAYRESGRAADALRTAQLRTRTSATTAVWSSFVVRANEFP
jgi:CHAT domain-containing protein/tetratricopeptide (TPR) repeat protein